MQASRIRKVPVPQCSISAPDRARGQDGGYADKTHAGSGYSRSTAAMKDDKLYLIHIRECIERVEKYTAVIRAYFSHRA